MHAALLALLLAAAPEEPPRLELYDAVGTSERLELRGRAVRGGAGAGAPKTTEGRLGKNLGRLLSDDLEKHAVLIEVAGWRAQAVTDDEGRFLAVLMGVPEGRHALRAELVGLAKAESIALVAAPDAPLVLSDWDDTLVVSHVPSRRRLAKAALLQDEGTQPLVPGMAKLLGCVVDGPNGPATLHVLTGSPLGLHDRIRATLQAGGFPTAELRLRNYGLGRDDDPLDPLAYKLAHAVPLLQARPRAKVLLLGDAGEKDPEIYAALAARFPGRVELVLIRRVEGADHAAARFVGQRLVADGAEALGAAIAAGWARAGCGAPPAPVVE